MMQINFQDRILENKDWATALFVFSFALIAVAKTTFENRFSDFLRLLISDKYIKIYKEIKQDVRVVSKNSIDNIKSIG